MSRIGRLPIEIPSGVTVDIRDDVVSVKGEKGELSFSLRPEIKAILEDNLIIISCRDDDVSHGAYWGMTRAIVFNMIKGVTEGYVKKLELVGVGYRAKMEGGGISLSLGYSHPIEFSQPRGILLSVEENKYITVSGTDKQLVGQTAAKIRSFRKPEPYKGKGIRYVGEIVKTKPGKSGKV